MTSQSLCPGLLANARQWHRLNCKFIKAKTTFMMTFKVEKLSCHTNIISTELTFLNTFQAITEVICYWNPNPFLDCLMLDLHQHFFGTKRNTIQAMTKRYRYFKEALYHFHYHSENVGSNDSSINSIQGRVLCWLGSKNPFPCRLAATWLLHYSFATGLAKQAQGVVGDLFLFLSFAFLLKSLELPRNTL